MRPWTAWRTMETRNYRFHYPSEFERWVLDAAQRVESIDSAITSIVGSSVPKPVDVVVHDPFNQSNGYALPVIDRPTTVWWATPPEPRNDIGDFRSWNEMLAVHELTHLAHLTRPTRNPLKRLWWSTMPAQFGPIVRRSPRWVIEGYATVVEGQITGTGRPNGVWRPALLRQWAMEGRLPTYGQLNGTREYSGGDFAYLSGSAFLEWLLDRQGDSSLVSVWRRMSARTNRTFERAFAGVYGDAAAMLYGRHVAEITGDAMRAKADLERAGLREGELVQRLNWDTGDPAITPDGRHVALTVRQRDRPSRLVVWRTDPDPVRPRPTIARTRDTMDVADQAFFPPPRRAVRTLLADNGSSFVHPRWYADNQRVMVTRWAPRADGSVSPDLYVWNFQNGALKRLTHGEQLVHGDPSPDSREAVAMRCRQGHCDIVRLYLQTNVVSTLLAGNPRRSYHRPRFSPDGQKFVASVSDSGRWRILVAERDGKNPRVLNPADGANRYEGTWLGTDSLIVVSERGGIPNLEVMSVETGETRPVTRVTGAAVAPAVHRRDGSIWFLSLHSRGLDLRRLRAEDPRADSVVTIDAARYGYAGSRGTSAGVTLAARRVAPSQEYGAGVSHMRWLPGAMASADGAGGILTIFRGDIVGRFSTTLTGSYGEPGTWQGASLRSSWRYVRPALELGFHAFQHDPSRGRHAVPGSADLDARGYQGVVSVSLERRRDSWRGGMRVGGVGGKIEPRLGPAYNRAFAFSDLDFQIRQQEGSRGGFFRMRLHAAQGSMRAAFRRVMATTQFGTTGRDLLPMEYTLTLAQVSGSFHPFEQMSIGGAPAAIMDSSVMPQRYDMPLLPTGAVSNRALLAWRVAFPLRYTIYAEGASLASGSAGPRPPGQPLNTPLDNRFHKWHRTVGIERRVNFPPVPVAFTPALRSRAGIGYSIDAPLNDRLRAYIVMRFEP
jgi:hypothetical protein